MKAKAKKIVGFSLSSRFTITLAGEILICVIFCLISLFLFLKLTDEVFEKEFMTFDRNLMNYLYSLRTAQLNKLMLNITFFGSSLFLFCASALTALYLYTKRRKDSLIFITIIFTGVILNLILKYFFARPRPEFMPLVHESFYSYPSGHAMNSFVVYTAIAYFIFRSTKNVKVGIIVSSFFAFLIFIIGLSRVYLGVHYPTDVIAGYIGGFVWLVAAIVFEKTVIFERLYKETNKKK